MLCIGFSLGLKELYLWKVVRLGVLVDVPGFHGGEEDGSGGATKKLADQQSAIIRRRLQTSRDAIHENKDQAKCLPTIPLGQGT